MKQVDEVVWELVGVINKTAVVQARKRTFHGQNC
jgi:hypothetical protein